MLLGLILSILTATYTVVSTTEVEASGVIPNNSTYEYSRTADSGKKGQMTAGNGTTLRLEGWDDCVIEEVVLVMHSNKGSGKGVLRMTIGGDVVWEILDKPFAHQQWAGAYSAEWVNVRQAINATVPTGGLVQIQIAATENSLYISEYRIRYTAPSPSKYMVRFSTGLDIAPEALTEQSAGAGVVLPQWVDTAGWRFVGWSEVELEDECTVLKNSEILHALSKYYPKQDTQLWAIYQSGDRVAKSTKDYVSGDYLIAMKNATTELVGKDVAAAMCGGVVAEEGQVVTEELIVTRDDEAWVIDNSVWTEDMVYAVELGSDSTLTMQHVSSSEWIGYEGSHLASVQSVWQYKVLDDGTLAVYYMVGKQGYALYMGNGLHGADVSITAHSQPMKIERWTENAFMLFPAQIAEYTCWPLGRGNGIERVLGPSQAVEGEAIYMLGNYVLYIKDGRKYLKLLHK